MFKIIKLSSGKLLLHQKNNKIHSFLSVIYLKVQRKTQRSYDINN